MRKPRIRLNARTRILAWIMVIVTAAVVTIVAVTARSLIVQVDAKTADELTHEAQKFHAFAAQPESPATENQPNNAETATQFTTVAELLTSYLSRNVPEHDEMFFTIVDGNAHRRSSAMPPARVDRNSAFVARAAQATTPQTGRIATEAGEASYAVIPVSIVGDASQGQLVIIEFLAPEFAEVRTTVVTMSIISLVALLLAGLAGWLVAGRVLAPIRDVRETAARIGESELDKRIEVRGTDDVALLASTFNHMLDRLEAAFEGQRRFLDDAGHELRTPITIVRGHLEVMSDDPEERAQTLQLVTDEIARMSRLVDDLIMLARSERPDFVQPTEVNLTTLIVEALGKASAMADRHWRIGPTVDATILADEQRLTQALLQLANNAVKYTETADTIEFGSAIDGGWVRIWVSDTGSGIPPADHERIFERFARGQQDKRQHGSGLGLAIIARIAAAHDGRVSVESRPGEGATFTIEMPYRQRRGE